MHQHDPFASFPYTPLGFPIMTDLELLSRITVDAKVMGGKPVIRGTRLTVEFVLNLLAHGETFEGILTEYSGLVAEDVHACLLFASRSLQSTAFVALEPT
jgi:uncharacterized protein (DUF433 family)